MIHVPRKSSASTQEFLDWADEFEVAYAAATGIDRNDMRVRLDRYSQFFDAGYLPEVAVYELTGISLMERRREALATAEGRA